MAKLKLLYHLSPLYNELDTDEQEDFHHIEAMCDIYDDEPDGAFFAIMEENGIDVDSLAWYSEIMNEVISLSEKVCKAQPKKLKKTSSRKTKVVNKPAPKKPVAKRKPSPKPSPRSKSKSKKH